MINLIFTVLNITLDIALIGLIIYFVRKRKNK